MKALSRSTMGALQGAFGGLVLASVLAVIVLLFEFEPLIAIVVVFVIVGAILGYAGTQ